MGDTYNVFISWSGERSKKVAEALYGWLRMVVQSAKPWMSEEDIEKGSRGLDEIGKALEATSVGIICLTPENLEKPWILFETGALSKALGDKTRVCPYLFGDLRPENVKPPLGIFQGTRAVKDDTRKLVGTINRVLGGSLADEELDTLFEGMWPRLEKKLQAVPDVAGAVAQQRSEREMVTEILDLTRAAAQGRKAIEDLDEYIPIFKQFMPMLGEALKTAQKQVAQGPPARETPGEAPVRKVFRVKHHDDAEIKRIEGLHAVEDGSGRLFVLDEGGRVIARFADVEQWWPEAHAEPPEGLDLLPDRPTRS